VMRIPLSVVQDQPPLVECTACGRCCTYVGIAINPPTRPRWATDILWYLFHEHVYVYVDGSGQWSVHFETRCRNLGQDLRCGIYGRRPHICRGFDNRSCEVNEPDADVLSFREPRAFLSWLQANRPRLYATIEREFVPEALRPAADGRARRLADTGERTQRARARRVARRARIGR
jgi:hypothetical protein